MSLNYQGQLQFVCDTCGQTHELKSQHLFFDVVDSEEKPNGTETLYQAEYDFVCEGCDKDIEVTYEVWEYPEGKKDDEKVTITNATVVRVLEILPEAV